MEAYQTRHTLFEACICFFVTACTAFGEELRSNLPLTVEKFTEKSSPFILLADTFIQNDSMMIVKVIFDTGLFEMTTNVFTRSI